MVMTRKALSRNPESHSEQLGHAMDDVREQRQDERQRSSQSDRDIKLCSPRIKAGKTVDASKIAKNWRTDEAIEKEMANQAFFVRKGGGSPVFEPVADSGNTHLVMSFPIRILLRSLSCCLSLATRKR